MSNPTDTFDAIVKAFLDSKPYPAYLEIGDEASCALMMADREGRLEFSNASYLLSFYGIKIKHRRYLRGWRVASEPQGSDMFLADADVSEYVRAGRGEPKRMVITSADFDEAEQLRYEAAVDRRIRG